MLALFSKPLIALAIFAALVFGYITFTKHQQSIGYNRAKAEDAAETVRLNAVYRIQEKTLQSQVQKAQDDALIAQNSLRVHIASATASVNSLRDQLTDTQRRLSEYSKSSIIDYASTQSTILAECSREYQALAAAADGHALDSRTLEQAWPKVP